MKRVISCLLCICMLFAIGALAGCGSNDAPAPTTGDQASPGTSGNNQQSQGTSGNNQQSPGSTSEAPAPGEEQYGGILRMAVIGTVATPGFTPLTTTNASMIYTRVAYESLLIYSETGGLQPWLATSWTTNPDDPSITWTLREGVQFADGEPFNAHAVKVNIEAYQENNRSEVMNVVSMDIINDYEIKMNLGHWNSSLVESIGFFVLYMSPAAMQDEEAMYTTTVGTGPFQLTDFVTNISATYERNDNYWQEGKPYLDGVQINYIGEITTMQAAFIAEEYDLIASESAEMTHTLMLTQPDKFASGEYIHVINASGQGLVSNGLIPSSYDPSSPFADARVRRAMAHAIDVDALIAAFRYGNAISTNQWAIPGSITFNESLVSCEYNPERARQLLAEAGYADGFDTSINASGSEDMHTAIAAMLAEVGIRTSVNIIDGATFFGYMAGTWEGITVHAATVAPDLGLWMGRHLGDDATFYGNGIVRPREAVELLERIRSARTDEEKLALSMEMQNLIYNREDGLLLFGLILFVSPQQVIKHSWLHNDTYSVNFNGMHVTLADAWLSR